MKRRILALVTAFVMVVTMLPASAFAEGDAGGIVPGDTGNIEQVTADNIVDTINSAQKGDIIELSKDITLDNTIYIESDKEITIDLKGHKLEITKDNTVAIDNSGKLTIKNGKLLTVKTSSANNTAIKNNVDAFLTIDQDDSYLTLIKGGRTGIENNGTATINDGKVSSFTRNAIYATQNSETYVNGGKIIVSDKPFEIGRAISSEGYVKITGGEINASGTSGAGDNYVNAIGMFYGGKLIIDPDPDKYVKVTSETDYAVCSRFGAKVEIYGGEFACNGSRTDIHNIDDEYDDVIKIYGGIFKHEPYDGYLGENCIVSDFNGKFKVISLTVEDVEANSYDELKSLLNGDSLEPKNIKIKNNITIPENADLTVKSGYKINIETGNTLVVDGILRLKGTIVNNGTLKTGDNGFIEKPLNISNNGIISLPEVVNNVCIVKTPMELQWLSYMVEENNENIPEKIILNNDIILPQVEFTPIGSDSFYYESVFDGNDKKISNLTINIKDKYRGGLFGNVGDVKIMNLMLDGNSTNSTSSYIGALVGYAEGSCTIYDVHIADYTVNSPISYGVGGFIGQIWTNDPNDKVEFINCSYDGSIEGYANVGGFWGTSTGSKGQIGIYNSGLSGTVNAINVNGAFCGGFGNSAKVTVIGLDKDNASLTVNNAPSDKYVSAPSSSEQNNLDNADKTKMAVKDSNGEWKAVDKGTAVIEAEVDGIPYEKFEDAVKNAKSGETVKLLKDYDYSDTIEITEDREITIDLAGHNINYTGSGQYAFELSDDIKCIITDTVGSGNITSQQRVFKVGSGTISTSGTAASLTVNGGTLKASEGDAAVAVYANSSADHNTPVNCSVVINKATLNGGIYYFGKGAEVTVNDGAEISVETGYAISGNGTKSQDRDNGETTLVINGGEISSKDAEANAIYIPQRGSVTINGGNITGVGGGVQVCSGTLNITGGNITATGQDLREGKTEDGGIPDGAAVSTVNRNYPGGAATVTITGGTFNAEHNDAVSAYTWENNDESEWPEAAENTDITGGTFSSVQTEYVDSDTFVNKNGRWSVGPDAERAIDTLAEGDTVVIEKFPEGESITVPNGVKVTNNTGNNITVNGETVKPGESETPQPPVIVYPVISRIAAIADQEYTGSAITPALTVYDTDGNIVSSNNYTATYTNNVEPGTATVTVTGKAGVLGSATATFTIVKTEKPEPPEPQPEKPGKVEITKSSSDFGRIRVYFDKVAAVGDNTMRYQIQSQKVGSDVVKTQYATVGYAYATVRDLAYNAKYNIRIRAYYVDENGERIYGDWSEVKSVYANRLGTANQVMYKAGITKLTAGKTSVAVNLKKVAFTKKPVKITYQIAYKKKGATKFSYAYTTNLKKTVYNLSKNTNYQFKVRYYYKSLVDNKLVFSSYTALKTVKTGR